LIRRPSTETDSVAGAYDEDGKEANKISYIGGSFGDDCFERRPGIEFHVAIVCLVLRRVSTLKDEE